MDSGREGEGRTSGVFSTTHSLLSTSQGLKMQMLKIKMRANQFKKDVEAGLKKTPSLPAGALFLQSDFVQTMTPHFLRTWSGSPSRFLTKNLN